ncbi:MAG: PD-(D/E)XK nuclease family protein [Bdellovibrionales bacterium]|nr:PD-(D/E)XK nuclease family protein [Bdellovibrionales bacterium]
MHSSFLNTKRSDQVTVFVSPQLQEIIPPSVPTTDISSIQIELEKWKKACIQTIENEIFYTKHPFFQHVLRKDVLAKEVFLLFEDVGFKNETLNLLPEEVRDFFLSLFKKIHPPDLQLSSEETHFIGTDLKTTYALNFTNNTSFHFWLQKHHAYPSFICETQYASHRRLMYANQMTYESIHEVLDFTFLMAQQNEGRIGIVISDPKKQSWLLDQCQKRSLSCTDAQQAHSSTKGLIVGNLENISMHALDSVLISDFWFYTQFSSSLWDEPTRQNLYKNNILPFSSYLHQELLFCIQQNSQNLYYLYPKNQKIPSLFFHPDEHPDPVPKKQESLNKKPLELHMEKYEKIKNDINWNSEEITFPDIPIVQAVSPSSLTNLSQCPRKYFFKHILKINEKNIETSPFQQNPKDFGIMIHKILQDCFSDFDVLQDKPEEIFLRIWDRVIAEFELGITPSYLPIWKTELNVYKNHIKNYVLSFFSEGWNSTKVEYRWKENAEFFQPLVQAKNISWSGQIDRIDYKDQEIRFIDYKTGSVNFKPSDILQKGSFLQMPLYLYFMSQKYPDQNIFSEIHQISMNGVSKKARLSKQDLASFKKELSEILQHLFSLIEINSYEPNPGYQNENCRLCSFTEICGSEIANFVEAKQ